MTTRDYGPPEEGLELQAYTELLGRCFGQTGKLEDIRAWVGMQRREDLRTLREGTRPVAALSLVSMGQFFGGRSVRTAGVAGVGIEPDRRGRGLAKDLMQRFLREMRESGYPLSTLYPSTYGLYRAVGYERAGGHWLASLRPESLDVPRGNRAEMRPATEDDEPLLRATWSAWARTHTGQLDRGDYLWTRVQEPRGKPVHACLVEGEGGVEGYVRWLQTELEGSPYELQVVDVAALTATAAMRILAFFAGHGSITRRVSWASGPGDPLLALLPERRFRLELGDEWMLRLVDVRAALEARGYPPGVEAEVHLALEDELLPENSGPWVLRVADGRGEVTRGGQGRLTMDVRGLAPLYSGYQSPAQLAPAGLVRGSREDLEAAQAVFAGSAPWMSDDF